LFCRSDIQLCDVVLFFTTIPITSATYLVVRVSRDPLCPLTNLWDLSMSLYFATHTKRPRAAHTAFLLMGQRG
jgi:hypothetical protein